MVARTGRKVLTFPNNTDDVCCRLTGDQTDSTLERLYALPQGGVTTQCNQHRRERQQTPRSDFVVALVSPKIKQYAYHIPSIIVDYKSNDCSAAVSLNARPPERLDVQLKLNHCKFIILSLTVHFECRCIMMFVCEHVKHCAHRMYYGIIVLGSAGL